MTDTDTVPTGQRWYRSFVPPLRNGNPTAPGRYLVDVPSGMDKTGFYVPTRYVCPMCSGMLGTSRVQPLGRVVKVLDTQPDGSATVLADPMPAGLTAFYCRACQVTFISADVSLMQTLPPKETK